MGSITRQIKRTILKNRGKLTKRDTTTKCARCTKSGRSTPLKRMLFDCDRIQCHVCGWIGSPRFRLSLKR